MAPPMTSCGDGEEGARGSGSTVLVVSPGAMRLHVLQHVPFEGPARIGEWARVRGHSLAATHLYAGEPLPDHDAYDLLVVMGGPMSVNDEAEHPWLVAEKRFVARALELERPTIGVCLGAQLIAAASGCRVYPGPEKEIGWFPVHTLPIAAASRAAALLPSSLVPFHWHGETFDLPAGAVLLAQTELVPHQAFWLGRRTLAMQFHIEATVESVGALVEHASDDITGGRFQQAPEVIQAEAPKRTAAVAPVLDAVMDRLAAS